MTEVIEDSQAYEYAEPVVLAFADALNKGPPVPPVLRKAQMSMARKQMGTRIDFVMNK